MKNEFENEIDVYVTKKKKKSRVDASIYSEGGIFPFEHIYTIQIPL